MRQNNEEEHENFKKELSELLKKYKAELSLGVGSDKWSGNDTIIVTFHHIIDERLYSELVLGTYVD